VRVGNHQPRQRHLLGLRGSQFLVTRAEHGAELLRQSLNPVPGIDSSQRLDHYVIR
jgi:hypothetical protein